MVAMGASWTPLATSTGAVPALDPRRSCWTSPRHGSASAAAVAVVGVHDLDAEPDAAR
jgi:hypothetical protein